MSGAEKFAVVWCLTNCCELGTYDHVPLVFEASTGFTDDVFSSAMQKLGEGVMETDGTYFFKGFVAANFGAGDKLLLNPFLRTILGRIARRSYPEPIIKALVDMNPSLTALIEEVKAGKSPDEVAKAAWASVAAKKKKPSPPNPTPEPPKP